MQRIEDTMPSQHAAPARRGLTQDPTLDVHSSEFEVVDLLQPATASWLGRGPFFFASVSFMLGTAVLLALDAAHTGASSDWLDTLNSKVRVGASVVRRLTAEPIFETRPPPGAAPRTPAAAPAAPAAPPVPPAEPQIEAPQRAATPTLDREQPQRAEPRSNDSKATPRAQARSKRERARATSSENARSETKQRSRREGAGTHRGS